MSPNEVLSCTMYASALPFGVMAIDYAVQAWPLAKWRTLRWASNRAFTIARALNRAKNQAHWDACN